MITVKTESDVKKVSATKMTVFAALFAALVYVGTMFSIPIPGGQGYMHLGDSLNYLCAVMLPFPYSAAAAAVGAALSDITGGFAVWAWATLPIKFVMAMCFTPRSDKIFCKRNCAAVVFAGLINIIGYYVAECFIYRSDTVGKTFASALASVPGNIGQSVGAAVVFVIVGLALEKSGVAARLKKLINS